MNKDIKLEAKGDFPFTFYIEKAFADDDNKEVMRIKGVASTVNTDHDNERMAPEALKAMARVINESAVPLRNEHQKDGKSILGSVNKAWVDSRNQLWIEADLDKSHPVSSMLYKGLKTGAKLGLSVGGRVKSAVKEFSESAGKVIKTFYDVVLDEVSVTSRPANYDAWLVSKSIKAEGEEGDFYKTPFYNEFLKEKSELDFMQSFAKSIPDESWKRVEFNKNNNNNNFMDDKNKNPEEAFKSFMIKGMETLTSIVAKLAKTSDKTDKEETTIMEDKKKSDTANDTEETTNKKETQKADDANDTKETTKAEDKKDDKKEDETTKAEDKKDDKKEDETTKEGKEYGADYQMKSMSELVKRMEAIGKAMDSTDEDKKDDKKEKTTKDDDKKEDETTKAEDKKDDKDETDTEKSMELDQFVSVVEKMIANIENNFAKSGKRVLGVRNMVLDMIKNDKEIQAEITGMAKEAGFKKSMSFGSPVIRSKEGQTFKIVADNSNAEKVEKSEKPKDFKGMWNTEFSSAKNADVN